MKTQSAMKRILAMVLAIFLMVGCLAGCGQEPVEPEVTQEATQETTQASLPEMNMNQNNQSEVENTIVTVGTEPIDGTDDPNAEKIVAPLSAQVNPQVGKTLTAVAGEEISYVMIYNPGIYVDDANNQALRSGDFSKQINIDLNRAGGLADDALVSPLAQKPLDPEILDKMNMEGGRADGLMQYYEVGDKVNFYCSAEEDLNMTVEQTFTCLYAGTHANIWAYDQLDQGVIDRLGNAFDETTYDACVSRFGEARFGEVVNILIYPFEADDSVVGFFYSGDMFSSFECDDVTAQTYGLNRDHNIININALWLEDEEMAISTLAHEFQHLLCYTGYFAGSNNCAVWMDEAMSGYIEDKLYPGIKESDFVQYHLSSRIRNGQSLYNFGTETTMLNFDIGVYGSVYLYAEYLENIAGQDIFSLFHANWRNTYVPMTTFEGLYNVVSPELLKQVDEMITYPDTMVFASEAEEWMSKLTLCFYLSTFTMDESAAENYRQISLPYLLYDSLLEAQIEGGGRIVLATQGGQFQIPQDADPGLIFVGLNENLEIVTNFACS